MGEYRVDPITDIFSSMHVAGVVHSRVEATAPWGLRGEPQTEAKVTYSGRSVTPSELAYLGMVSRGNCWLSVDGIDKPIPLTGGDCFLLAPGNAFIVRDSPQTRPVSFCGIKPKDNANVIRFGGGGAPTTIISGYLSFDKVTLKPVAQLLPKLILVKSDQARTLALHTTLQLLASETAEAAPGSEVLSSRLAEAVFIQMLRAHISLGVETCTRGWLRAIFDPQIGAALKSIHEDVKSDWTVDSLAAAAGMSRSAFAARFKEVLAQTPLEYVTEWRMQKATELLRLGNKKLIEIANSVGYDSDAAFSKAFKRLLGSTPGEYRRNGISA
jgi:AraC-like DNA-binding protein